MVIDNRLIYGFCVSHLAIQDPQTTLCIFDEYLNTNILKLVVGGCSYLYVNDIDVADIA